MRINESRRPYRGALLVLTLAMIAACSRDPILGNANLAALAPKVLSVTPVNGTNGVVPTNPGITATLNEPVAPLSGANFTVTCAAPCVNPTGTVTLDATRKIATFTVTPAGTYLDPLTLYTATVTGATSTGSGLVLAAPYVWRFTTGTTPPAPTVTAAAPVPNSVGVPLNVAEAATFSEPMAPLTGSATFTVTCAAPCTNPAGTVALDATGTNATFTPSADLAALTVYTATITGATSLASNLPLAAPYVWHFTTGVTTDTTRPRVLITDPATTSPGPTVGAPVNAAITAAFTKDMAPLTISGSSFTVTCTTPCVSPAGTVTYQAGARTAVFTPTAALAVGTTYTATITTAATDLAGNALAGNQAALPAASNYVWTFTTAAATPPTNVTVQSTSPAANATGVCPTGSINATFNSPRRMDPATLTATTFTVTGPAPAVTPVTPASVVLDPATGRIATFTAQSALTDGGVYQATIKSGPNGVKDLAIPGNQLLTDFVWSFTVGTAGNCLAPVALGAASPFGDFGGTAGMTNQGILTVVNGDTGTIATGSSSVTGFHDTAGDIYTQTGSNVGTVNGTIYTCTNSTTGPTSAAPNAANCSNAQQALLAAQSAYTALQLLPTSATPAANLAGLTLGPGVYTAPAGSFMILGSDLTLDGGGDVNAVWVFQMATTLTVGDPAVPRSVILSGGAQAKNVFWQVGAAATINAAGGGTMVGTIIAQAGAAFSTVGNVDVLTLNGRALSLGASVTLVDTVINVPAP